MEVLWSLGAGTVAAIHAGFPKRRRVSYNTVLTQVRLLYEKGLVMREQVGRGHVYRPRIDREQALQRIVKQFVDHYFAGSVGALGEHLRHSRHADRQTQGSE